MRSLFCRLSSVTGIDQIANGRGLDEQAYRNRPDGWPDAIVAGIDRSQTEFEGSVPTVGRPATVSAPISLNCAHLTSLVSGTRSGGNAQDSGGAG